VRKYQNALILLGIVLFTAIAYANSVRNGYIDFDDPENVVDNYSIREFDLANLKHYFTTPLQFMYTPIVSVSYALDYHFGKLSPSTYHLTNLLLHLCNVVLVYVVFSLLTRKPFIAHFVAAAFAIHPMNVDAISWISTRSNLLATFFFLGALALYTVHVRTSRWWLLLASVLVFALATLSKSTAVVFPLTLFLWDYYLARRRSWRLLLEKIPYFVVALAIGLVTLHFREDTNSLGYSLVDRFFLICSALASYVVKLFFPYPLAFAYGYPVKHGAFLPWYLYLSPLLLVLVVWLLTRTTLPRRVVVVGLSFFVINVLLSQTVFIIDNYRANRYAYLPYLGLFFIIAHLVDRLLESSGTGWRSRAADVGQVALIMVVVMFTVVTVNRNALWRDTVTILDNSITHEPGVPFVYNSRGIAEYKAGNYTAARQDFEKTISLNPDFYLSYYYLGVLKFIGQDYKGALADYDIAISRSPGFVGAYNDRGRARVELKDYAGAVQDFSKALELDSYFVDAYFNRGVARFFMGDYAGAIADYTTTLEFTPDNANAYNNRASARIEMGDPRAALPDLARAIQLSPGYADAFFNRGVAESRLDNTTGACADWRTAQSLGHQGAAAFITKNCPA
jgi:tetratricopeptide (TPR) repeat protein